MKRILLALLLLSGTLLPAVPEPRQQALDKLREKFARERAFRRWSCRAEEFEACDRLLLADGTFSDLAGPEREIRDGKLHLRDEREAQVRVAEVTVKALNRLWRLAEPFRNGGTGSNERRERILRGIVRYGTLETERVNSPHRFLASCFDIPTAVINTYFCFFADMKRVEAGAGGELETEAHALLRKLALQAWEVPARGDRTDGNVVTPERFRGHVWWVGANAVTYRPALQAAIMLNSIPMVDVMAQVADGAVSAVSQNTVRDAFWNEGITADGAGWGHGRQCLVWGYPTDGLNAALWILETLKGTPWAAGCDRRKADVLLNYLRGSSFFVYREYLPPGFSRSDMLKEADRRETAPSVGIARKTLKLWDGVLEEAEKRELRDFIREAEARELFMDGHPAGRYGGSRYFFNNDKMIRKGRDWYLLVNMASFRCDGLESAYGFAAGFNFFTCDGATLFQRTGNEFRSVTGALDLTAWPGVTARQTPEKLLPVTNWRGFCSRYDFAGGATAGGDFAAGFRFEKFNASAKEGVNDRIGLDDPNRTISDVRANKSYFLFGSRLLALGCGITNLRPELEGGIRTTLEQTLMTPDSRSAGAWEWNNGFAYRVLPEHTTGTVSVKREKRRSNWRRLSERNADVEETLLPVFQMSIDHGREVRDGTYAYVVECGSDTASPLPRVLANTPQVQAAENAGGTAVGAVIYDSGAAFRGSRGVYSASAPCVMLAEYRPEALTLTVADAAMDPELRRITVSLPEFGEIAVPVPQGELCGKPATVVVKTAKAKALEKMRNAAYRAKKQHRWWSRNNPERTEFDALLPLFREGGTFSDLAERESRLRNTGDAAAEQEITLFHCIVFNRLWTLAEPFRTGKRDDGLKARIFRAIARYGPRECGRSEAMAGRWYHSAFGIPTAAMNLYFCFFPEMQAVESGRESDPAAVAANRMLKEVALLAWKVPLGTSAEVRDIFSMDRFRHNMEWVGGNGMVYRSALLAAVVHNSVPMMDIVAESAHRAVAAVSQSSAGSDFWPEGFLADGSGMGRGRDGSFRGYPCASMLGPLDYCRTLKATPWGKPPGRDRIGVLFDFFRGSAFYEYKGFLQPVGERDIMEPEMRKKRKLPGVSHAELLLKTWPELLTGAERDELKRYLAEAGACEVFMPERPAGEYHGTRYFFNSEDLIRKTPEYYFAIDMGSRRTGGTDSPYHVIRPSHDFFASDGAVWLERGGDEHARAFGAYKLTAVPGVTARQTPGPLRPFTEWQVYCSEFNFAAGATTGEDAVAGFRFRKSNPVACDRGSDPVANDADNRGLYGVTAYKSYFLFGDTLLALGCGITNESPELPGEIRTVLEQTLLAADSRSVEGGERNNGFVYRVLPEYTTGKVRVTRETRRTRWRELTANPPGEESEIGIFEMSIDHGREVKDGTCAYLIECRAPGEAQPKILSNTPALQAAESADGHTAGAVFHDPRSVLVTSRGTFGVSAPCALLVEYAPDRIRLTVADARMDSALDTVVVTTPFGGKIAVDMPSEPYRGKPATLTLPGRRMP